MDGARGVEARAGGQGGCRGCARRQARGAGHQGGGAGGCAGAAFNACLYASYASLLLVQRCARGMRHLQLRRFSAGLQLRLAL